MITPNMSLPVPSVGVTSGPQYATDLNACMSLLDSHNHTPGAGVAVPTAGLNINADLAIGSNNLDATKSVRFTTQSAVLTGPSDVSAIYSVLGDLYFNDSDGTAIRITQSGAVVGTPGSITNLAAPASATYVPLTGKFVWQSDVNTPADMDFGSAILRNLVASGFGLTLAAPTLASDYQITLPPLPNATKIMAMTSAGVMTAPYSVDNSTIEIATNVIQVKDSGIVGAKIATNVDLPGNLATENGKALVVSNTNAASSLAIVRVQFDGSGNLEVGEGATCVVNSSGVFTVTFTTAFASAPVCVTSSKNGTSTSIIAQTGPTGTTSVQVCTYAGSTPVSSRFSLVAIGPRA